MKRKIYYKYKHKLMRRLQAVLYRGEKLEKREEKLFRAFYKKAREIQDIGAVLYPANQEEAFDRGFIMDYVSSCKQYIKGDILEFAGGNIMYADMFGMGGYSLDVMAATSLKEYYPKADIFADLEDVATLPIKKYDCIIATQVICNIYDSYVAMCNLKRMLKPGGYLILTVPGNPTLSEGGHHLRSFSEEALMRLCEESFGNYANLISYGNFEYALQMLMGMKKNPYDKAEKMRHYSFGDRKENKYSIIVGVLCRKE